MYLSDIEIVGFKSFAQKTRLKFAPGLSAVVGPNGCGKTNVVDAIRWVLGEKKASTLRSDVMENVIFNGTKDRKPLSLAEVSITFDNTKNILPTEYNEIVVSRRLYRSGESEYLLNKTQCRLKDILDLFMDTGIGSDSYSVIELKMVDAILSGKVDDRRAMFEEAAGIKKYKARRKESIKKLDSVKSDMERINDILQEVRKNVNSLSRQAAKTKRYNQYLNDLRSMELELFAREFEQYHSAKIEIGNKLKELASQKIKCEIEVSKFENNLKNIKDRIAVLDNDLDAATVKEKNLLREIAELKQKIAVSTEKTASFDSSKKRISDDISESEQILLLKENELKDVKIYTEELKSNISQHNNSLKSLKVEAELALSEVREIESKVNSFENDSLSLKNKIDSLQNILRRSKDRKSGIERKIQQLAEDKYRYLRQAEDINDDITRYQKLLPELQEELLDFENELKSAFEQKIVLESELEKIKQALNEKQNNLSSRKASLDFLNSLTDNNTASKFLLETNKWEPDSEKQILGEIVGTDDEYRLAVLTALGEYAHSFLTSDRNSADKALNLLKVENKGKSGFVCLDLIPDILPPDDIPDVEGVIGWVSEIVRVEDNIRNFLRGLLGRTLFVKDADTAHKVLSAKSADLCISIDGVMYHSAGLIVGGSVSQKEGQWVGKKERIKKVKKEIDVINSEIEQFTIIRDNLARDLASIEIHNIQQNIKKNETKISDNKRNIEQLKLKIDSINNNINFIDENTLRLQDELGELSIDDASSESEIHSLNEQLTIKQTELLEKKSLLDDSRKKLSEKQEVVRNSELVAVELESSLKASVSDSQRLNNEIERLTVRIKQRKHEFDNLDFQKDEIEENIMILGEKLASSESESNKIREACEILIIQKKEIDKEHELVSSEIRVVSKDFDKIREQIHQLEIMETETNSHLQNITERALEQYETDIEDLTYEANPEFEAKAVKSEIQILKEKLAQLGNVNFMALEEYEVQNERLEFYEKQMSDLTEAEKLLVETIEEINSTAEKHFRETFDKIRVNFKDLFQKLFGNDGQADINLESDDLLESDIVITAKPPNKRPHSIEMLSGGEKTLTAIALLFAIYLVKPSPFCILDEVDAPLDDANIDKFVKLIKEFSIDTQFLIVTHNKKTMEAADTLYGVTMQEDGVSKVVAVKLNEDAA